MTDNRDILAFTEKEIWEEARDRLKIAQEAESDNRKYAKDDLKFCEGDQWPQDAVTTVSQQTPELTINITDSLARRVVNNMKQQRPRGKCHPVGDGANIDAAEVINGIGRHIEYRSEASIAYDTAGEMAVKGGWGYWRLVSEYASPDSFDQEIRILLVRNIFTVFVDPGSIMPTASDMDWCLITGKMKRTEYKRKYPRSEPVDWADTGDDKLRMDWEDEEEIRLAEYFRIRETSAKLYMLEDGKGSKFTRFEDELPSERSMAAAGLTITDMRISSRRLVEWFQLNGMKVIDRRVLPGTYIPLVRCEGNAIDIDGVIKRRGMVRAMQDPQRMVNYGETAKIMRLGLTPKAPWVAAEGQLEGHEDEWANSNQSTVAVLTYKPVLGPDGVTMLPPPSRTPPAQIEPGFSEMTQGMKSNLLGIAGMPNDPGQDMNGQVVSGAAINRRQGLSDQSHFQYYDNQTFAIAQTWRIILEWIPHYYSEERMQRIIGDDGTPAMVKINEKSTQPGVSTVKNDLSVGRYDVVMDTGPGYETRREEGADALMQLMATPLGEQIAKVGPDLVIRTLDHPYMQELADRFAALTPDGLKKAMEGLPSQAKSIIQSLSNQLAQAKQQLQQMQSGLAKAHLDATVKAHDVEVHAETEKGWQKVEMDKAHLEAINKLDIEHLKSGTQILDHTHERAHEKAMDAQQQLNKGDQP